MSQLLGSGKIFLVREPISGRFGIPRLMAMLSSKDFGIDWNGIDEITVVTFNRRRNRCIMLHCDFAGVDRTVRVLNSGLFKVDLGSDIIPEQLTRGTLRRLLLDGTLSGEYAHPHVQKTLENKVEND